MGGLGVLFAVEEDIVEKIRRMPMAERPEYISEQLEDLYFDEYPERTYELDRAWEAIYRTVCSGTLDPDPSLRIDEAVLSGDTLYYDGEMYNDYLIFASPPKAVSAVSQMTGSLEKSYFCKIYESIDAESYTAKCDEDMETAFEYLSDSAAFWRFAADNGLWVLFTADR